jgi:hypothetical protein
MYVVSTLMSIRNVIKKVGGCDGYKNTAGILDTRCFFFGIAPPGPCTTTHSTLRTTSIYVQSLVLLVAAACLFSF